MTVQIPALATPVPQSTDPVNFAARADAFLASLVPFAEAANRQNAENNQLNESTALAAGVAQSASVAAMAALGAPRFDPALNYLAGNQVWSPVDAKVYRRLVAGRSAVDPSADPANWRIHMQTKADLGLGNVDNTSDANKPVSIAQKAALDAKETPAGALAQMQGFGLGAVTGPVVADMDALRAGGFYSATVAASAAAGLPLSLGHSIAHMPGSSGSAQQFASPITSAASNRRRLWHRQMIANGWSAPREVAFLDDPVFTGTPLTPNLKLGNVANSDVNVLDYYEEGTFTPSIEGTATVGAAAYSVRHGRYTRIGNRVFWTCRLTLTALGDMAGSVRLGGFPFITANAGGAEGSISVGFYQGLASGAEVSGMSGLHRTSANNANLYRISAVSKNTQALAVADISNVLSLYASGQYEV